SPPQTIARNNGESPARETPPPPENTPAHNAGCPPKRPGLLALPCPAKSGRDAPTSREMIPACSQLPPNPVLLRASAAPKPLEATPPCSQNASRASSCSPPARAPNRPSTPG